ncbi:DEKNAAC100106 [Brettanomyces naardenensis]|uniref:DEKNAAC100106 n=1 Tax=Brettanomyces naardenensis TaxID=13370 RepID=A0A448YGL8_BRENA|nr:DEKNAAC100106 [Brettanomyces naardenensis]
MSSLSSLQGSSGKLLRRIHRACRPTLDEPNIALNLEICDLINQKQGNLPREAAVSVVKLINSRDPQVAELALTLLDYLVKNCGYPIQLQISRKEFLNELVKRFPERPPPGYTRIQRLILGTIAEWVQTICKTSRYKEDLGYIRDMYRLLRSKGYDFPAVRSEDAAVLNPSDNLKSIEELQQEERVAQSAKLQELIRRGRPQDLKEANELMKIMSGFKGDDSLEQTKNQVHEELDKVGRKADLLDEMLNNATNVGTLDTSDETVQELISAIKVAQPKLQKIIQEESDDTDSVQKLLALNDKLNGVLRKVGLLTKGDTAGAAQIKISGSSTAASQSINLIDFDDDSSAEPTGDVSPSATGVAPSTGDAIADLLSDLGGLSFDSNNKASQSTTLGGGAINLFGTPEPQSPKPKNATGTDDLLSGFGGTATFSQPAPASTTSLDPFQFDLSSPKVAAPSSSDSLLFSQSTNLKITYTASSKQGSSVQLTFRFSNLSLTKSITGLQFSLAVTKHFELTLQAPSGFSLNAGVSDGVTQLAVIKHRDGQSSNKLKLKFKCVYQLGGVQTEDQGVVTVSLD